MTVTCKGERIAVGENFVEAVLAERNPVSRGVVRVGGTSYTWVASVTADRAQEAIRKSAEGRVVVFSGQS